MVTEECEGECDEVEWGMEESAANGGNKSWTEDETPNSKAVVYELRTSANSEFVNILSELSTATILLCGMGVSVICKEAGPFSVEKPATELAKLGNMKTSIDDCSHWASDGNNTVENLGSSALVWSFGGLSPLPLPDPSWPSCSSPDPSPGKWPSPSWPSAWPWKQKYTL